MIKALTIFVLFIATILLSGCGGSERETNSYNAFYAEFSGCKLTKECINKILINYITYEPNGFFIIQMDGENGDKNVYVQGTRSTDNSFHFEAVSQVYSDEVTPEVISSLVKLGWNLPYDNNFTQKVYYDQILNMEAANLLYLTLESYNQEYDVITDYIIAK